nr:MAG TPA: hypothetical protein [Caudoviricetes sp.]
MIAPFIRYKSDISLIQPKFHPSIKLFYLSIMHNYANYIKIIIFLLTTDIYCFIAYFSSKIIGNSSADTGLFDKYL